MTELEMTDDVAPSFENHFDGDIDDHFPIHKDGKPSYREGQKEAIQFILNSFNKGKKIVLLEGPTGSGKSAIGMTVASMAHRSYYLTATKILQDQLTSEFDDLIELKGRNAYPCTFYERFGPEMVKRMIWTQSQLDKHLQNIPGCNAGHCKTRTGKKDGSKGQKCLKCFTVDGPNGNRRPGGDLKSLPPGMIHSACPYYEQVYKAVKGRKVTMNFSSFLFQTTMTKRFDVPRDLMIVDECHNIEPQLLDFVSLTVNDANLRPFGVYIPKFDTAADYATFFAEIKLEQYLKQAIDEAEKNEQFWVMDDLSRTMQKYQTFVNHIKTPNSEWVCEHEEVKSTGNSKVTLKPVYVHGMSENLLFRYGDRILLMSATILDVDILCRSLGVDRSQVAAMRMKNRFPVKNRPIYIDAVAKMTGGKEAMIEWGPKLTAGVNKWCEKYPGQRGIIHTHNFAIQELLKVQCKSHVRSRFLLQQNFKDKSDMLALHAKSKDTIIVAPAMHEGIDLHGDLSRFQLICKIPYANCFDNEQLARRVEADRRYYVWLTTLKLVQSYGRSVRSETDFADTYILDESIYKLMADAKKMLPDWFTEAIIEL